MQPDTTRTETTFSTRDYWIAGALLAAGKALLRVDWRNCRGYFVFPDLAGCEQLRQAYWSGELKVTAKNYSDALRTLKARLHEHDDEATAKTGTPA